MHGLDRPAIIRQAEESRHMQYEKAVKELEHLSRNNWRIGEIADRVEAKYGEQTLQKLAEDTGIDYHTLKLCRQVHRAWTESDKRLSNLSWSIHMIFASQPDRFDLIKQKKWTAKEAREEVKRRNQPEQPEPEDEEEDEVEEEEELEDEEGQDEDLQVLEEEEEPLTDRDSDETLEEQDEGEETEDTDDDEESEKMKPLRPKKLRLFAKPDPDMFSRTVEAMKREGRVTKERFKKLVGGENSLSKFKTIVRYCPYMTLKEDGRFVELVIEDEVRDMMSLIRDKIIQAQKDMTEHNRFRFDVDRIKKLIQDLYDLVVIGAAPKPKSKRQ